MFHADGETDIQKGMARVIVIFFGFGFANAPKNHSVNIA